MHVDLISVNLLSLNSQFPQTFSSQLVIEKLSFLQWVGSGVNNFCILYGKANLNTIYIGLENQLCFLRGNAILVFPQSTLFLI